MVRRTRANGRADHLAAQLRSPGAYGAVVASSLLVGWLLVGTLGFMAIEGWSALDAVYMTVITLSTVGYAEVMPLSAQGKVFASVLIVAGLGTAFYAISRIGQVIIEGELLDILGRRRMTKDLERMEDHYILCGFGRAARPVAQGLAHEGQRFCVIEVDPSLEPELVAQEYLYVIGDATDEEILETAGITRARGLIALLPSDADNLYLTMSAKVLNHDARVIAKASNEKAEMKMLRGGADDVVATYKMASFRILQAVTKPSVLEFMELVSARENLQLSLEEITVGQGSALAGSTVDDEAIRSECGVIIVALRRDDGHMLFNPARQATVNVGDTLIALGPEEGLRRLEQVCTQAS